MSLQANAEGITWLAASGDAGAADCDGGMTRVAEAGLAVDAPGSIPEVTSMGGTEFNEGGVNYWPNNAANGYIPEMVWNETGISVAEGGGLAGGGGGESMYFTQPPGRMASRRTTECGTCPIFLPRPPFITIPITFTLATPRLRLPMPVR